MYVPDHAVERTCEKLLKSRLVTAMECVQRPLRVAPSRSAGAVRCCATQESVTALEIHESARLRKRKMEEPSCFCVDSNETSEVFYRRTWTMQVSMRRQKP